MGVNVIVPVRVRVRTDALDDPDAVASAVATATGRALDRAAAELGKRAPGGAVVVHSPHVRVSGNAGRDGGSRLRVRIGDAVGREARRRVGDRVPRKPGWAHGWWEVVAEVGILVPLRHLIALLDATGDEPTDLAEVFVDRLDAPWRATVMLVEANIAFRMGNLGESVSAALGRRGRRGDTQHWAYTTRDEDLKVLATADSTGRLRLLPPMKQRNRDRIWGQGADARAAGGCLVTFVMFGLPASERQELVSIGEERSWRVALRRVSDRISAESFQRLFGVSLDTFVAEYGDRPVELRALPVSARRPLRYETLRALTQRKVLANVHGQAASFGGLHLFTRQVLAELPPEARANLADLARHTLDLDPEAETGTWQPGWSGAYLHVVVQPSPEQLERAKLLPQARQWAEQLLGFMRRDPTELAWQSQLYTWLLRTFGSAREPQGPHRRATLLFDRLLQRDPLALDRLLDMVEKADNRQLHHLVLRLLAHTPHAGDARVRVSIDRHERASHRAEQHTYDVARQVILLDHNPGAVVRGDTVIADVDSRLSVARKITALRSEKQAEIDKALHAKAQDLLRRIASGKDTTDYTEDAFVGKALDDVQQQVKIDEDDLVQHEVEASLQLIHVGSVVQEDITRFQITYRYVERIDRGEWEPIKNTRTTVDQAEFEEMLRGWRYRKQAAVIDLIAKIVTIGSVAAITIVIAAPLLVAATGGWSSIVVSIGFSEVMYLLTHKHYTAGGILSAAVEGFIYAIGFGVLRGVGPALAKGMSISTKSLTSLVFAAVVRKGMSGAAGGALSAVMIRFYEDMVSIQLGQRREFSSLGEYILAMSTGAVLGMAFELTIWAGGVALRGFFAAELRSLGEMVAQASAEALSRGALEGPSRAALARKLLPEALLALKRMLQDMKMKESIMKEVVEAFGKRFAAAIDEFATIPLEEAALRAGAGLTAASRAGLRRLAVGVGLGEAEALELVNRLARQPAALAAVLESLGHADQELVARAAAGLRRLFNDAPVLELAALARGNLLVPVALSERGVALALTAEGRASLLGYLRRSGGNAREAMAALDLYVLADPTITDAELRDVLDRSTRHSLDIERMILDSLDDFEATTGAEALAGTEPPAGGGTARPRGWRDVLDSVKITPADVDGYRNTYKAYVRRRGARRYFKTLDDYARFRHGLETKQFTMAELGVPPRTWTTFYKALERVPLKSVPVAERNRLAAEYQRRLAGEWGGEPFRNLSEDEWVRWRYGREQGLIRPHEGPPPGLGDKGRVERLAGHELQRWVNQGLPAGSANSRDYRAFGLERLRRPDHLPPGSTTCYLDNAGRFHATPGPGREPFSARFVGDSKYLEEVVPADDQTKAFVQLARGTDERAVLFFVRWRDGFPPPGQLSPGPYGLGYELPEQAAEGVVSGNLLEFAAGRTPPVRIRLVSTPDWK